jgi:import receptor subunit TOM70
VFQWKQDIAQAETLCKEALAIDPDCDVAVATVAQLCLQTGRLDEAITWFAKSASLARTEGELTNSLTCELYMQEDVQAWEANFFRQLDEYASRSQAAFIKNYPEYAERLGQMAAGM